MPVKITMPALSPTMTEGNLARWFKREGEAVAAGDVLVEIETDQATMEVEAVDEGTLGRILVPEGTEGVPVNAVIALLLEDGEDASALDAVVDGAPEPGTQSQPPPAAGGNNDGTAASPLARRVAEQAGLDLATVTGSGVRGRITRADVQAAIGGGASPAAARPSAQTDERLFASPLARRMAREAGLELSGISGSGPGGRIVQSDVATAQKAPAVVSAPAAAPAPVAAPAEPGDGYDIVAMSTMRKVIAERMVEAKTTVPHFYLSVDCEIDEMLKVRKVLNERLADGRLSVNDFIIRACALALIEVPDANVAWAGDGRMRRYRTADISVAVAIEGGLITPIIRGAESKGLADISRDMKRLAEKARDGQLAPEEYQGGSFSVSNLGMFGIKQFDAVINPPQGCILAVGAGEARPVVHDGELAVATVMTCTLSCDHRVVDGATGALVLSAIKRLIEYPPAMLL